MTSNPDRSNEPPLLDELHGTEPQAGSTNLKVHSVGSGFAQMKPGDRYRFIKLLERDKAVAAS